MKRNRWQSKAVSMIGGLALAIGASGPAIEAQAMTFGQNDMVLALYANGTEYYRNLGSADTLLANGTQTVIDIGSSALNPFTATTGSNPIFWSLLSGKTNVPNYLNTASRYTTEQIIFAQTNQSANAVLSGFNSWRNQLTTTTGATGTETLLPASDPSSFSNKYGLGGTLGGNWTGGGQYGELGEILTMVNEIAASNILSDVGRATLAQTGILTICGGAGCSVAPVPVPAAVWLFGSGLAAMVGVARRKMANLTV